MFRNRLKSIIHLLLISLLGGGWANAQTNPYESTIRGFEAADAANPPPPNSIVFVGSSSIVNWRSLAADFPRFNVLNRGFGGSQSSDALFFFDRIVTPYRPPIVVYYEGDNDISAGRTEDQVFNDWTNLVGRVRAELPNTHVVYISIKPSPSRQGDLPKQRAVNDRVRADAQTDSKLHFADVATAMLTPAGAFRPELYVSDQLHMTDLGYVIWRDVVGPIIDQIAAEYPIRITRPESGSLLVDLGAAELISGAGASAAVSWNNVSAAVGGSNSGALGGLVATSGNAGPVGFQMLSRFNGANENGTTSSTHFPSTATRDSLFGNTETFSGLANITPRFKITGLAIGAAYRFTFFASRTGVSDNRQTRYTVTGSTVVTADLNPANNVDQTAAVDGMSPDESGSITVALSPGPANNNANHFTYLGVLQIETVSPAGPSFLLDFGAVGSPTGTQTSGPRISWNNLTPEVGATDTGALGGLVGTNGASLPITLQMISRFNAANQNGSGASPLFPSSAAQDSLFGNTEAFNSLVNVFPAFKFQNLNPSASYDITFYASRNGVNDNRQTRYTANGAAAASVDLDAANNIDNVAVIRGLQPDGAREIAISLAPGPENNNANHFTYLGVVQLAWTTATAPVPIKLTSTLQANNGVHLHVDGVEGMNYQLQGSADLQTWHKIQFVGVTNQSESASVQVEAADAMRFYRALQ